MSRSNFSSHISNALFFPRNGKNGPKWNCTTDPRVISTVLCSLSYRPVARASLCAPLPASHHTQGKPPVAANVSLSLSRDENKKRKRMR